MHTARLLEAGVESVNPGQRLGGERQARQLVEAEEPGPQAVVEVVVAVRDVVRDRGDLRLQRRVPIRRQAGEERVLGHHPGRGCLEGAVVLEQPLQRLAGEVQPVEAGVAPFEPGHDAEGLQVMIEAAERGQRLVQRGLAGMAEGAVAQVVREGNGFRQVLVDPEHPGQGPGDLGHLQECVSRVRKWSPSKLTKTWVLYSSRRNGIECTIRSRSRWKALRNELEGSGTARPRLASGRQA